MSARAATLVALAIGAASLVVPTALGYDAWAWMVWARELGRGDLATIAGPSWKPLPALVVAPVTLVADASAPWVWVALVRAAAVGALMLAFALGRRLAGTAAGVVAAVVLALSADLPRTALPGSSEPVLVALLLAALLAILDDRPRLALAAAAAAGLVRPEAWPFIAVLALWILVRRRGARGFALIVGALAPVVWLGLDWAGSGNALNSGDVARIPTENSAAGFAEALGRVPDTLIAPAFAAAAVAVVLAALRRERRVLLLAGGAAAWILIVAVGAEAGFTGARRYLAAPAAVISVLAGVGVAWALAAVPAGRLRTAAATGVAVVVAAFAFVPARTDVRQLGVGRSQADQLAELRRAVRAAGGRDTVLSRGRPAVNPWLQTALAWELDVPLAGVQPTWGASRWRAPAFVFRAPRRLAGPRPRLPDGVSARRVARAGRWQVLVAGRS